ncbi:MAG: RsmF rRNA methyltransferase first C-terminal domain-containing protein [Streptococcaceae bacterium]|jgi:16S rRNA C967 or C1407 C5-methylase (RsmB/RsmF family)/NOL1/NOP2/fmu family ribosome biogenesis protein|nr:RsmF rRNA methyltransferase first C-terminal domain-containing protein [Streptococcaceae bacterium]
MKLPDEFLIKYQKLLGASFDGFLASFDAPAISGFRVNPQKNAPDLSARAVDRISELGFQGKISGKSPTFLTGAVYSQEPAAQQVGAFAEEFLAAYDAPRVLDLCAAPGGKSTHLLSLLSGRGVLVSNEISSKRAKILVENLERWGAKNSVILNENPARLALTFPEFFDVIVVDAPCSGEGMFRKDAEAVAYWSQEYVESCAHRQREILSEATKMLAPGGVFVYATCTWAPEEDEAQVAWLSENYGLAVLKMQKFWPHEFAGEGQFVSVLKKTRDVETLPKRPHTPKMTRLAKEKEAYWKKWARENLHATALSALTGQLQTFGDALYLLPDGLPDLSALKIARNGLHLGTFKKNRFEPSLALALSCVSSDTLRTLELTEASFSTYLAGETLPTAARDGWTLLTINQNPLDFAKIVSGTIKNHYPKGLRIRR